MVTSAMDPGAEFLFAIGLIMLLGLAADFLGRWTVVPRVTLLLVFGVFMGEQALGVIPESVSGSFAQITQIALLMVGFLLGGKLTSRSLKSSGRQLLWISLIAAVGTSMIVAIALLAVGVPYQVAVPLGCIAAATAPAATVDTVLEAGSDSKFSRLLLGIVAIDDAWALVLLSLGIALVAVLDGGQGALASLLHAGYDIGGAVALGVGLGIPAAYLTGRVKAGQPMLIEALGLVLTCGGAALWLGVSFIIAAMVMGMVIVNRASHHDYPFHEIENVEWPFMVVFFVLAGASLELTLLADIGLVGAAYMIARVAGKLGGAWLGARVSGAPAPVRQWMGVALLPQAGVAIGMALLVADQFEQYRQVVLTVVTSTTVLFELFGPMATRFALNRAKAAERS